MQQDLATTRVEEEQKEHEDEEAEDLNDNPEIYESERLKDPLNDRVVKDVPRPPTVALSLDRVFPLKSKHGLEWHELPNLQLIKEYLKQLGVISKELMMELIDRAKRLLNQEPNLVRIDGPTHIFGDIHG